MSLSELQRMWVIVGPPPSNRFKFLCLRRVCLCSEMRSRQLGWRAGESLLMIRFVCFYKLLVVCLYCLFVWSVGGQWRADRWSGLRKVFEFFLQFNILKRFSKRFKMQKIKVNFDLPGCSGGSNCWLAASWHRSIKILFVLIFQVAAIVGRQLADKNYSKIETFKHSNFSGGSDCWQAASSHLNRISTFWIFKHF